MKQLIILLHPKNWLVWLAMLILRLVNLLPLRLQLLMGKELGRCLHLLVPSRRRIVAINIALCFPEMSADDQKALVEKHFYSIGMMLPEIGLSWWASDRRLAKLTEIEGLEFLEQAIEEGKGALLLGAHYSTLEISGHLLTSQTDLPVCSMYRPQKNAVVELLMRRGRASYLDKLISRRDIRGLLKSLKQNKAVWYAPDQAYQDKGYAMVPFFGVPAPTNTSTSRIAKLSKAAIIPFVSIRKSDGSGYKLTLKAPLKDFPTDDEIADATRVHQVFEENIRQQPDQYFWIHKRFKNRNNVELDQYVKKKK
ncbi:MAG: LpxL/LpxP family Kdo(2)-lipid IV(A) lauroyl/palmitoleoyl acyltransferase [Kangiellaceae bacterium]|nr:LpxL/LpxP family Kdo(2)-lipid IV(A) lauroyl/palmitoleoyl acyltransferase [Kangiellaceae bacterium]